MLATLYIILYIIRRLFGNYLILIFLHHNFLGKWLLCIIIINVLTDYVYIDRIPSE